MTIDYRSPAMLDPADFISLAETVWEREFDLGEVAHALTRTINSGAWDGDRLVGSVRVLTDGYLFGTVPDLMVDPDHREQGIGRRLMELAWESSPTGLYFGAQPGNEIFFEKLGYEPGPTGFQRRKPAG